MASFNIDIDRKKLCAALREQAKQNSRSVEEEITMILRRQFPWTREPQPDDDSEKGMGTAINEYFADLHEEEPELPPSKPGCEPPKFE